MFFTEEQEKSGTIPKYKRIKQYISYEIVNGSYGEGQALPSENELVEQTGMSRTTVRQAIKELENEGRVRRIKGKGTFPVQKQKTPFVQKSHIFAIVLPEIHRDLYPQLVKGFDEGAVDRHYRVLIGNTDDNVQKQGDIILGLIDKNISGVALVPPTLSPTPDYQIRQLVEHGISVVCCHRPVSGVDVPLIAWNWQDVGRMAAEEIVRYGHTKIAYFAFSRYLTTQMYEKGMRESLESNGLTLPESRVFYAAESPKRGNLIDEQDKILEMLKQDDRPTAIFCCGNYEAEHVVYLANEIGLKVPEDLSVMGFGEKHRMGIVRENLSSVVVEEFELGRHAAKLLHQMCSEKSHTLQAGKQHYMPLELSGGRTLGHVPDKMLCC